MNLDDVYLILALGTIAAQVLPMLSTPNRFHFPHTPFHPFPFSNKPAFTYHVSFMSLHTLPYRILGGTPGVVLSDFQLFDFGEGGVDHGWGRWWKGKGIVPDQTRDRCAYQAVSFTRLGN